MDNLCKSRYRRLCAEQPSIPLFSQAWWLDAIVGDNWDVILIENDGVVQASLPFVTHQRLGMTIITQPPLTQNLGPWLRPSTAKYAKRLGQEKDVIQRLFAQLPKHDLYRQNWHYSRTNWLPLYWQGYEQTTRYTYRFDNISDLNQIWSGFQENIRTDIRKAEKQLKVRTDLHLQTFIELNNKVFQRQNLALPYTQELLQKIDAATARQNARQSFIAEDNHGRHHAGVYIVWDKETAYYLMGGGDPDLRNSGATSLCMWHAIQFTANQGKNFDFEGSMIEPVERFFRAFGAQQTPYFAISKTNSRIIQIEQLLRKLKKI